MCCILIWRRVHQPTPHCSVRQGGTGAMMWLLGKAPRHCCCATLAPLSQLHRQQAPAPDAAAYPAAGPHCPLTAVAHRLLPPLQVHLSLLPLLPSQMRQSSALRLPASCRPCCVAPAPCSSSSRVGHHGHDMTAACWLPAAWLLCIASVCSPPPAYLCFKRTCLGCLLTTMQYLSSRAPRAPPCTPPLLV